jgi:cobalt-zinc-cadmium efflux system outer membrane protein
MRHDFDQEKPSEQFARKPMTLPSKGVVFSSMLLPAMLFAAGCGTVSDTKSAFDPVASNVKSRTGQEVTWIRSSQDDGRAQKVIDGMLTHELTASGAVEIALVNNRSLQATLEEIGISQADLVDAGLLKNPVFFASSRFPRSSPSATDLEFSVVDDFLDILVRPMRRSVAKVQMQATQLRVSHAVIQLAADVKIAYFAVLADKQLFGRLEVIEEADQAGRDLARRMRRGGTGSELELANQEALWGDSHLALINADAHLKADREALNRLLGLWGRDTAWTTPGELPDIPAGEIDSSKLESIAVSRRLDLQAAKMKVDAIGRALALKTHTRYAPVGINLGFDTERSPDGQRVTGPTLDLALPLFNQGQGDIARLQAQYRQAADELQALAIGIRSNVREQWETLTADRQSADFLNKSLLPERIRIANLTLKEYNFMLAGVYDLIFAKQNELRAEQRYVEAARDYWIARVRLEEALGGSFGANREAFDSP